MRYTKPQITRTFAALCAIQSVKGTIPEEQAVHDMTTGAAYQSDE